MKAVLEDFYKVAIDDRVAGAFALIIEQPGCRNQLINLLTGKVG